MAGCPLHIHKLNRGQWNHHLLWLRIKSGKVERRCIVFRITLKSETVFNAHSLETKRCADAFRLIGILVQNNQMMIVFTGISILDYVSQAPNGVSEQNAVRRSTELGEIGWDRMAMKNG